MIDRIGVFNSFCAFASNSDRITRNVLDYLSDNGFFDAPASSKYHLCCESGLAAHSLEVARQLKYLTEDLNLGWEKKDSPIVIGLLHDLCKMDQYIKQEDGTYTYNEKTLLKGHGEKSVMILAHLMKLTEEEVMCIRYHMGAFSDDAKERSAYSDAVKKFPNVLFTHTADMIASQVKGM